ncbi:hypothetical protein [Salmonirosea aquatica]|uniref:DUF4374 domain-containing protein n=1 Tax=Salmonirosea aquatica TaxID=2654236 RepID=A0A7C9BLP2_9BACT|nr:hypothetical protein [Cytophagaceae bacterium SJW1-29]
MKNSKILSVPLVALLLISCDNNKVDPSPGPQYKESGYVISSVNESTGGSTYYAGYFEDLPGSTPVDMTAKSTYNYFFGKADWKNYIFGTSLRGDRTLSKIAVDQDGKLVEVASIPLLNDLNFVKIIDDNLGLYTLWNSDRYVGIFNPSTMEALGQIDMSKAKKIAANSRNYYSNIVYRKQDNRVFLALLTDNENTSPYYDATDVYVEVINLTSRQWEKTITYANASYPVSRGNENQIVDESGNIYIFTQGSYGLDGQMGPRAAQYARPQILKIPANSTDFDASYSFNPVNTLGQQNLLVQLMLGSIYDANGIAYSCISAQPESPRILELVGKFAQGIITEAEFFELRNAIFYSENQRWVKLDLNAKTVSVLDDIPFTAGFGYPNAYKYDGKFYFQYNTASNNTSGFYEYDPGTGRATKAFSLAKGGIASDLIRLNK